MTAGIGGVLALAGPAAASAGAAALAEPGWLTLATAPASHSVFGVLGAFRAAGW